MSVNFICFIGIDGSGKTSLAKYTVEALSRGEDNFIYVHSLIDAKLLKPFMRLGRSLFAREKSKEKYSEFARAKRKSFSKYKFLFLPYKLLLFMDYAPQVLRKVIFPLILGKRLVSDRYVYDTLINMGLNMNYDASKIARSIKAFLRLFPKPDITFLIDIPEEVAFTRKDDIPDIEYLRERRYLYLELAEVFNMLILDGTKPLEALTQEVLAKIRRKA